MVSVSNSGPTYQVGGSLPGSAQTYVRRRADHDLYAGLQAGEFCYVLNSRQMGKSSLRVQTMQRLQSEGFACAAIDITKIGSQNITPDQWYASIIGALAQGFELTDRFSLRPWWRDRELLSPVQRLGEFIEGVLLPQIRQRIVIFVDEIDSVLSLNFPMDDFFALIRAHYNNRADDADAARLTFVLLGVAAPSSLIQDKQRTPFNIGRAIPLDGLQVAEAEPLEVGLIEQAEIPPAVIREILTWSGGQPFLTQKLCRLVQLRQEWIAAGTEAEIISQIVRSQVIENWEIQDEPEHLKTIRNRLLVSQQRAGRLLGFYQTILQQGQIIADDSPEQMELRLTGLVTRQGGVLRVYNPIYASVFNLEWVEKELANLRPYAETFQAWISSGGTDSSRLLRGQALQDALNWASNKSLSDTDYQFLTASQEQENQDVQQTLVIERRAKQAAEQANQILTEAQGKAVRILRRAFAGLGIVSVVSVFAIAGVIRINRDLQISRQTLSLEQASVASLEQFPSQEINSLLAAIQAGRDLQALVGQTPLANYPTTRPLFVLQTMLDTIHEKNVWDAEQGKVLAGSFTADSQRLITAGANGSLKFWQRQGKFQQQLAVPRGVKALPIRLSPDGKLLAIVNQTDQIQLLSLSNKAWQELPPLSTSLNSLSFSPNGQYLAAAGKNGRVYVWNLKQPGQFSAFLAHADPINSLSFTPDSQRLLTAGQDGTVRLWTLSGDRLSVWQPTRTTGIKSISVNPKPNPESAEVASAGEDGFLRLWSLDGQQLNRWRASQITVFSLSFSPDGQSLLTLAEDSTVSLWDLSGQLLMELKGHKGYITSANWSPDGQQIVTTGNDGTVRLWNVKHRLGSQWASQQAEVWSIIFSPDGQDLATASQDGTIKLWNRQGQQQQVLKAKAGGVYSVAFSPNKQRLAAVGQEGQIWLWNRTGQLLANWSAHNGAINEVLFSPDSLTLATAGNDGKIRVWDQAGRSLAELTGHEGPIWSLSISPDGQRLASTGPDGTVKLWSLRGETLLTLDPEQGWLSSISFSPDGQSFAAAGQDGMIRRWNLSGKNLGQFRSHPSGILSLSFSPTGESLATAGQDGTVKVWSLSGQQTAEFRKGGVKRLAFSPKADSSGQWLATVGQNEMIQLQQVGNLNQLLSRGCTWLADYLLIHPTAQPLCDRHNSTRIPIFKAQPQLAIAPIQGVDLGQCLAIAK
ncbi:MAG: AAA-like domain-containing protein [Aphanocapsa sp. GSE-SYN-MK-11-07L]|jgi:WD40 repeat protein|nr:AAA-like domain-containing protein [Aphanocapsa sp. GSE-SYN-MK-11-07L]